MEIDIASRRFYNLTREERNELYDLKDDPNIIIKGADSGSAVVVCDREDYLKETSKQLGLTMSSKKPSFGPNFGPFGPNSGCQMFFFENMAPSVTRYHGHLSSCAISQKTNDPILRKLSDGRTDGRMDEQRDEQTRRRMER